MLWLFGSRSLGHRFEKAKHAWQGFLGGVKASYFIHAKEKQQTMSPMEIASDLLPAFPP